MGKKTDLESVHLVNHSKCMLAAFQNFRQDETMLDVTLVCEGMRLKAHKLALSACSPFFKELFTENPCSHPIIILRHFEFADLKAVIDFIYKGELSVPRERLMSALKVAEELHIRGLRRSEPNTEKYEKLYNQVCGKLPSRKKRKRQRHNSTESDEKEYVNISDSDRNNESDDSVEANCEAPVESQQMDVESADMERNSTDDKDTRPVVLRVGDISMNDEGSSQNNAFDDERCITVSSEEKISCHDESPNENLITQENEIARETYEATSENLASSSQLDSYAACSENSNSVLLAANEQCSFQVESMEPVPATECSEEQVGFISSSCLSPKTLEAQQNDETKFHDEGKRFICSKCDGVFTSRINFMRHKALGHNNNNNAEKSSYECQHCTFTTDKMDCLKSHLLSHSDSVPFKCSECSAKFPSEELYKKHVSVHELEEIALCGLSSASKNVLPKQSKNLPTNLEFRCSICFMKFSSKLRCQFHEKNCQGTS